LLAIGRRGTPRQLGVPGEELPNVIYRLIEPEQFAGQRVVVVGGGDSALEAAATIAEQDSAHVTLSYRRAAFDRARPKNRTRVADAVAKGKLVVRLNSQVERITPVAVTLREGDLQESITSDAILICAGGELPTNFLKKAGVEVETKFGTV
jgi:thioredoxin reductase